MGVRILAPRAERDFSPVWGTRLAVSQEGKGVPSKWNLLGIALWGGKTATHLCLQRGVNSLFLGTRARNNTVSEKVKDPSLK